MTLYYYKRWKMYKNIELLKRSWQKELARSFLNTILRFPLRAKKEDCIFPSYQEASLIFPQHLTRLSLVSVCKELYRPLIGQHRSRDLNTGLWLVTAPPSSPLIGSDSRGGNEAITGSVTLDRVTPCRLVSSQSEARTVRLWPIRSEKKSKVITDSNHVDYCNT